MQFLWYSKKKFEYEKHIVNRFFVYEREYLKSELTLGDVWKRLEECGIDRKTLEATNPSSELLFPFYTAITKLNAFLGY